MVQHITSNQYRDEIEHASTQATVPVLELLIFKVTFVQLNPNLDIFMGAYSLPKYPQHNPEVL
jgi:hypothetical protein